MSNLSYEQKMRLLQMRPENKDKLLLKLLKGEVIDITKDEDLFYQVNKDRVSLDEFTNRDKFKASAENMKHIKETLQDKRYAKSKNKKFRWLGDIPPEIYFSRPEFSPLLDRKERDANIRKWLNKFPTFRAGEKQV